MTTIAPKKEYALPDTSRLVFHGKGHYYELDGKKLSGVTTVINETSSKGALVQWAANMACDYVWDNQTRFDQDNPNGVTLREVLDEARTAHARKRDGAASKGTDTHTLVEDYINYCLRNFEGKPTDTIRTDWEVINPFAQWAYENVDRFLAAEQRLYSETHGFAGTCDFIAIIDGKLTIGDLKTFPKMWSADAFIRMGAYSLALSEMTDFSGNHMRAEQSVIVKMCDPNDPRIKKYGGKPFAVYPRYALAEDEGMFLTRLRMYRYNENFVSPKD